MRPTEIRIKKYFGQHLLINEGKALRIAKLLEPRPNLSVLEVGPGTGNLTCHLLNQSYHDFKVVEIDAEAVALLKQKFPQLSPNSIIAQSFLDLNLNDIAPNNPLAIVGNFPYNISTEIMFKVLEYRDTVTEVVGMFQREVAERICAKPGSKIYGIPSVLLQAYYDVEYCFELSPGEFMPPPKVHSAVIRLIRNTRQHLPCDEKLFERIVKLGFQQRRKTLRNSLRTILPPNFEDPILQKRPEQLSVEEFISLTLQIANYVL